MQEGRTDTRKLLRDLVAVSREAGRAILDVYNSEFAVEQKADRSPLTLADKRSHEIISGYLREYTSLPVMSEEGKDFPYEERKEWEYFWLVDPLDGTKEFVKKSWEFTVNISLIRRDRPILGVIYIPVKDIVYHAAKGEGAYRVEGGRTQRLPRETGRQRVTVVGSRSHATRELAEYVEGLEKKYGEVTFISAGSSLKFCLVAEGEADIYPRLGPTMEWDTAAGQVIVEEAGGRVEEWGTGRPLVYNKRSLVNPFFIVFTNRHV